MRFGSVPSIFWRTKDLRYQGLFPEEAFGNQRELQMVMISRRLSTIQEINSTMDTHLQVIDLKHWARHAFDLSCKFDHINNNMTESWNVALNKIKGKLIIILLKDIRRKVNTLYGQRFDSRTYIVNVKTKACDHGYWQVSGILCEHACRRLGRVETVSGLLFP